MLLTILFSTAVWIFFAAVLQQNPSPLTVLLVFLALILSASVMLWGSQE